MNRLIAVVAVLLLGTTARADMGMPGSRRIPVRITLTADSIPPGVVLFVSGNDVQLHRMTVGEPVRVESRRGSRDPALQVYSVSESIVEGWRAGMPPSSDWFSRPNNPNCKEVFAASWREERVTFDDDRSVVEMEYRLVQTGDGARVEKVFENQGSRGYQVSLGLVCCFGIPAAMLGLWSWLVGRLFRRRAARVS